MKAPLATGTHRSAQSVLINIIVPSSFPSGWTLSTGGSGCPLLGAELLSQHSQVSLGLRPQLTLYALGFYLCGSPGALLSFSFWRTPVYLQDPAQM